MRKSSRPIHSRCIRQRILSPSDMRERERERERARERERELSTETSALTARQSRRVTPGQTSHNQRVQRRSESDTRSAPELMRDLG